MKKTDRWLFLVPPVLAFGLFLVYLAQIRGLPFFKFLVANPLAYDLDATQLLRGIPTHAPFFLSALYPAFVGLIYALTGGSRLAVIVCQGVLLALNVYLVSLVSRRLFSRIVALAAGFIMAFYWSFYYFAGELVPATVFLTLVLSALVFFLDRDRGVSFRAAALAVGFTGLVALMYATPGLRHLGGLVLGRALPYPARFYVAGMAFLGIYAAGGLALFAGARGRLRRNAVGNLAASGWMLGVATLAWSGAAVLAGFLGLGLLFEKGARPVRVAALVLGFAVPILASTAHNYATSGDLIPVTSSFGVNVFIGNNAASDGMDPFRLGQGNRVRIEADRLRLSGKQRSDFFLRQALEFIRSEPRSFLRLLGRKAALSVARTQINNNADIAERRAAWKHLFVPFLNFGIVFPFAAAGIVATLRERRKAVVLVTGYLSFFAVGLVFFVCERFRLPAIMLLIPLAAFGAESLLREARRKDLGKVAALAAAALAGGLASNIDFLGIAGYEMPAITANKAYVERMAGNLEASRALAMRALELDPSTAGAYHQLGAIAETEGNSVEALTYYLDCLERDPFFAASYQAAGSILNAARINTSYLDAYVDALINGGRAAEAKADLIRFAAPRLPRLHQ